MLKEYFFLCSCILSFLISSCSVSRQLSRKAENMVVRDSIFQDAHLGIAIFDPVQNKMLYEYQAKKYFVPASNVKIVTCYAAMKHLGDELAGLKYFESDTAIILIPTGDPTFLHPDYTLHPVWDFLNNTNKKLYITDQNWQEEAWGYGWSWNDYNNYYMAERSPFPVYGNTLRWSQVRTKKENPQHIADSIDSYVFAEPDITWEVNFTAPQTGKPFSVRRERDKNFYTITEGLPRSSKLQVPFVTDGLQTTVSLLKDTIHKEIEIMHDLDPDLKPPPRESFGQPSDLNHQTSNVQSQTIHSRPTDSMLRPMMHRSDNFFAEQALLMVSNELLGAMNDQKIIDHLLSTELRDFPQKPRWVDGSGLSRYNLFTPGDFVWLLDKMKREFPWERLKEIFPTGGTGTLRNFYRQDSGFIYAKTGTLSGSVSLSGYLITKRNNTLIFSVLVNNSRSATSGIRGKVEELLSFVRAHF